VFFSLASQGFFRASTITLILKQASVLAIVSTGLTFVLLCGEIDLAVGMVAVWTACLCGWIFENQFANATDLSWANHAILIAFPLITATMLGVVSGAITVFSRLPSFIITLAVMNIAEGMARYLTRGRSYSVPGVLDTLGNRGFEFSQGFMIPFSAILAAIIMLVAHVVLQHVRFGRYVYMVGGNREAARLSGVRTGLIVTATITISAFLAGVGGLLNAGRLGSVSLDQNQALLLSAVACVVLGGTSLFGGEGGMGRTLLGVLTFAVLQVGLNQVQWIDDHARSLLLGLVLMTALVINGLLGRRRD
jgi:ribose transport system permease protein